MYVHEDGMMRVIFFLVIMGPLSAGLTYMVVSSFITWLGGFFDYGPIFPENQPLTDKREQVLRYTTNQRVNLSAPVGTTVARVGLVAGEREMPPRASFFGRLGGQEVISHGEYEEKVLNTWEKRHWDEIKAQKLALDTPIGAKIAGILAEYGISEQNPPEDTEIIPKENRKRKVWDYKTNTWS